MGPALGPGAALGLVPAGLVFPYRQCPCSRPGAGGATKKPGVRSLEQDKALQG